MRRPSPRLARRTLSRRERRRTAPRCQSGRTGFTLVELLVVVGIIAMLIALLVPSLVAARREARRVVCQSQIKQVVVAMTSYLDESKGVFPRFAAADINFGGKQGTEPSGLYGSSAAGSPMQRKKPVNKHLGLPLIATKGADVFSCPDDRPDAGDPAFSKPLQDRIPTYFAQFGTSFFANPLLIGATPFVLSKSDPCYLKLSDTFKTSLPTVTAGQYQSPSKLLFAGDAVWQNAWNFSARSPVRQWHGGYRRYNVGFADGHVDTVEIRQGIHVSSQYTVLPTRGMQGDAAQCQSAKEQK